MSGHSKWAGIKHKKALVDAKRGKLFTKLIREVTIAARSGGNAEVNPRLRLAVQKARVANRNARRGPGGGEPAAVNGSPPSGPASCSW